MMGQRPGQRVNLAPVLPSNLTSQAEEGLNDSTIANRSHSEALPSSSDPVPDPESEFEVISIDGDINAVDSEARETIGAHHS